MARKYPGLTGRMANLMGYIESYTEANGYSPSYEDMKEMIGLHSKSGIHRLVTALEERGYIRRLPFRARSIEVARPSIAPILRVTVELDSGGRFLRLCTHDVRAVILVNCAGSTRPATAAEVIAA